MNEDLARFFKSIDFESDKFDAANLDKVVYRKNDDIFVVYIKNNSVIDIDTINNLMFKSSMGINGSKKCLIELSYDEITEEDIINYINYLTDEIIIKRPSLIDIKKSNITFDHNIVSFFVANEFIKNDLLNEVNHLKEELSKYGFKNIEINVSINEEMRKSIQEEIEHDKQSVTVEEKKSPCIIGNHKDGDVTKLNNILGETKNIIVEVYIFNKEVVERQGKKGPIYIVNLKASDKTDSYLMKFVRFDEEEFISINKRINEGSWYRVYGHVVMDEYLHQMVIDIRGLEEIPSKDEKVVDNSEIKRVELHAHTMMSMMDGVIPPKTLATFASKLGMKAVAVTDHNCLQAYPDIYNALAKINKDKENKFKAIYGAELNVVDVEGNIIFNNKEFNLFDQEYVVFDTETTGLNSSACQMIEIGAVKVKNNEIIDRFDELIAYDGKLPDVIVNLTNITDDMLKGKDTEEEVTKRFLKFIDGLPLVAHNAQFDISFVKSACKKYNLGEFNNTVIDTMALARNMYPDWRNHKLSTLVKNLEVEWDEDKHHRADYDAEGTSYCFYKMLYELKKQNYKTTLDLEKLADIKNE